MNIGSYGRVNIHIPIANTDGSVIFVETNDKVRGLFTYFNFLYSSIYFIISRIHFKGQNFQLKI